MEKKFELTPQQKAVVTDRGGNLLVAAAAGSGKTKVLVDRIMERVCNENQNITDFLVITYTKAAATELRAKITAELSKRLAASPNNKHLQNQMHLVYGAQISTVHSFCANLLRTYAAMADLAPDFRVMEEQESRVMKADVMEDLLEHIYANLDKHENIKAFIEELAFGRDDSAVPAITYGVYDTVQSHPWRMEWVKQCLSNMDVRKFSDAAETPWGKYLIDNAKSYIRSQLPLVELAIELCEADEALSAAYTETLQADYRKLFDITCAVTWNDMVVAKDVAWGRLKPVKKTEQVSILTKERIRELRDKYKLAVKNKLQAFDAMSDTVLNDLSKTEASINGVFELVKLFTTRYSAKKRSNNVVDFSDLEHMTIHLLLDPKTHERTEVAADISKNYCEIMVDEYQDSNGVQETIFEAISTGSNRFMVGDVKQSIYRFRLADPSIFLSHYNAYKDYTEAREGEPRKVLLSQNFRSRPEILEATNDVMHSCMSPVVGGINYNEEEALAAGRTDFPEDEEISRNAVELVAINMEDIAGESTSDDDAAESGSAAKIDIEAKYVAQRIQKMLREDTIMDEDTHEMRPITANDIVVLMRSTKNSAPHYVKALTDLGIASKSSRNKSIMDTTEIQTLYAYLQIIDSPVQDIPLISVMASPLVGFTADELADIRINQKETSCFYDALVEYAATPGLADNDKSKMFLAQLARLRSMTPYSKLSDLFTELLFETDAEDVFGSLSNGEQRMANVRKFGEMISSFEMGGARGLFGFLCHIESLIDQGEELPQASACVLEDEAVTIMSIHASKGLEFPIVFLTDLSRRFNTSDVKSTTLLHPTLGVGVQLVEKDKGYRHPTIARTAIANSILVETKSEELRVLYVAMTRAKQRLVMTYCDKLTRTMQRLLSDVEYPLPASVSQSVNTPGEWIILSSLLRPEAKCLRALTGLDTTEYHAGKYPWNIKVINARELHSKTLTMSEITESSMMSEDDVSLPVEEFDYLDSTKIRNDLAFEYKYQKAIHTPAVAAASTLSMVKRNVTIRRPNFAKKKGFSAAEKGTATHKFLQYADFQKCVNESDGIQQEIIRLKSDKFLSVDEADAVLVPALKTLFTSKVGKELALVPADQLHREYRFSVLAPGNEVFGEEASDDDVLLQGIIDLFYVDADGIHIIDFKTDYLDSDDMKAEKSAHYKTQLDTYAYALRAIYEKTPIADKTLIYVRYGKSVSV